MLTYLLPKSDVIVQHVTCPPNDRRHTTADSTHQYALQVRYQASVCIVIILRGYQHLSSYDRTHLLRLATCTQVSRGVVELFASGKSVNRENRKNGVITEIFAFIPGPCIARTPGSAADCRTPRPTKWVIVRAPPCLLHLEASSAGELSLLQGSDSSHM